MTSVSIKNLTKRYGKTVGIENLNLDIKDGEFFVLLGPSGCGKTTALLCIAGLLKPNEGSIRFNGELITSPEHGMHVRPQDRDVAMMFQDYAIYPHMTVFKNIAFPLEIRGRSGEEIEERVTKIAKLLNIPKLLDRKPAQLSGGQRQRAALGRAIIRKPKAFLMDEPLANLDAKLRVHARAEFRKLHEKLGTTVILVTHDQVEAMTIGDRIAILNNGALEQVGSPEEVYNNPKNMFVAGFIGSPPMNMLEGGLVERDGNIAIDLGVSTYELPDRAEKMIKRTEMPEVVLGIRPEHITIIKKPQKNAIKARFDLIESIGREYNVHFTSGEKSLVVITSTSEDLKVGEEVWLLPDEKRIHLFDKKTGKAIL